MLHLGTVTNTHRQYQTTMLFRSTSGTIPKNTRWIDVELRFQRQKGYNGLKFGMADNLKLIIEQNLSHEKTPV